MCLSVVSYWLFLYLKRDWSNNLCMLSLCHHYFTELIHFFALVVSFSGLKINCLFSYLSCGRCSVTLSMLFLPWTLSTFSDRTGKERGHLNHQAEEWGKRAVQTLIWVLVERSTVELSQFWMCLVQNWKPFVWQEEWTQCCRTDVVCCLGMGEMVCIQVQEGSRIQWIHFCQPPSLFKDYESLHFLISKRYKGSCCCKFCEGMGEVTQMVKKSSVNHCSGDGEPDYGCRNFKNLFIFWFVEGGFKYCFAEYF